MNPLGILLLGCWIFGSFFVDAEKVVFVMPRYVKRSYQTSSRPFFNIGERDRKSSQFTFGPKIPASSSSSFEGFGNFQNAFVSDEKRRFPQASYSSFEHGLGDLRPATTIRASESSGKGIPSEVRFVKPFVPLEEPKASDQYVFRPSGTSNFDFANNDDSNRYKFGSFQHPGFQSLDGYDQPRVQHATWHFPTSESSRTAIESHRPSQQPETTYDDRDTYEQKYSSIPDDQRTTTFSLPQKLVSEESRAILQGDSSPLPQPAALVSSPSTQSSLAPIVISDTVDMREYVEKLEAFTKHWSGLRNGFGWPNQIGRPTAFASSGTSYRNFSPWTAQFSRPSNGYEVQEDTAEERSALNYRTSWI